MTKFIFARHAETGLEKEEQKPETKLSLKGKEQAKKLANKLQDCQIDVIYSSFYQRTAETAEIITAKLNLPVLKDERLKEILLWATPNDLKDYPAVGETLTLFEKHQKKRLKLLEELRKKYKGKNVLVISHGNFIRSILGAALKMKPETLVRFYIDCASITTLSWENGGFYLLGVLNDTSHL